LHQFTPGDIPTSFETCSFSCYKVKIIFH
jgi:hypothetical protein